MADYNREILVPYLRDVCCSEMMIRKLEKDISKCASEAKKYAGWAAGAYTDPKRPNPGEYEGDFNYGGIIAGGVLCLAAIPAFSLPLIGTILGLGAIFFGLCVIIATAGGNSEKSEQAEKRYNEAVRAYNEQVKRNEGYRNSIPGWKASADRWREQERLTRNKLSEAKKLREDLYALNIIPSRYRNIHAAYYLYDYFYSCRETDLDKIIQTMLLDEIVQRMDKLIVQNQQILLNQRMQIALQEDQNRTIADNHCEHMKKIASLEHNQERQLDYQRMIEANQEVTNFFLAVDYIEKHR